MLPRLSPMKSWSRIILVIRARTPSRRRPGRRAPRAPPPRAARPPAPPARRRDNLEGVVSLRGLLRAEDVDVLDRLVVAGPPGLLALAPLELVPFKGLDHLVCAQRLRPVHGAAQLHHALVLRDPVVAGGLAELLHVHF